MRTDRKSDNEAFREVLIEEARARAGEHPGLESLAAYLAGDSDADADERVADHLAGCPECASATLDLATLMEPDVPSRPSQGGVADLELESAWRAFESRIGAPSGARHGGSVMRPPGARRWPMALAASLLLATLGLSIWVSQLLRSQAELGNQVAALSRPQINPPIVYLDGVTRTEPTGVVAELSPDQPFVLLIAIPSSPELFSSYEASLTDASGTLVWSGRGLELSDESTLRLWLPRALLPAGDYQVRIRGLGANPADPEDAVIATPLRVVHR